MTEQTKQLAPTLQAGGATRAIVPQDFDSAYRIANAVVMAGMAPKGLDTPERCTIAILHGLEVGMTPMAALQSIAVVNGRPTIWGDGALGLVQGSGLMEAHKEWFEGTGDTRKALCTAKRKGDPEIKSGEFSVADAKKAGLWGKAGPWSQYPDRMLKMRARGFVLRDGFADVLRGLGIAEEVQDYQNMRDITPAKTPPTPPTPPKPPSPPKAGIDTSAETVDADGVIHGEIIPRDGETPPAGEFDQEDDTDFFTALEAAMEAASDAADVEEIWTNADPLARFEGTPNVDANQAISLQIKKRALKRIGGK